MDSAESSIGNSLTSLCFLYRTSSTALRNRLGVSALRPSWDFIVLLPALFSLCPGPALPSGFTWSLLIDHGVEDCSLILRQGDERFKVKPFRCCRRCSTPWFGRFATATVFPDLFRLEIYHCIEFNIVTHLWGTFDIPHKRRTAITAAYVPPLLFCWPDPALGCQQSTLKQSIHAQHSPTLSFTSSDVSEYRFGSPSSGKDSVLF